MTHRKLISPENLPSYGITFSERWRRHLEEQGRFPKRVNLSERKHAYVEGEIFELIESRINERDSGEAA